MLTLLGLALAAATGASDNGTRLSITASASQATCVSGTQNGTVTISAVVTSTASVDPTAIEVSLDGAAESIAGIIPSSSYVHSGRDKQATMAFSLTLPSGKHSVSVCADQHGDDGRLPKESCTTVPVTVSCASCRPVMTGLCQTWFGPTGTFSAATGMATISMPSGMQVTWTGTCYDSNFNPVGPPASVPFTEDPPGTYTAAIPAKGCAFWYGPLYFTNACSGDGSGGEVFAVPVGSAGDMQIENFFCAGS